MKIILSRKGFDSASGGYPSPYFIDDGRLISFPIPEENDKNEINTGLTYADLLFDEKTTYLDLMKQLGIHKHDKKFVHLDPDVNPYVLLNRQEDWRGLFGQCSSAQSHLRNKEVESGDLFLFFGWFRDVVKTDNGYQYIRGTDKHMIWGYLQVDEIESINEIKVYEPWKRTHPHYFYRDRTQNTAYIARKQLEFFPQLPGFGTFDYHESLVLTHPQENKKSVWKLPKFFHPHYGTKMSYHEKRLDKWELYDSYCILNSVGRGQEFVIEGDNEVITWAKSLLNKQKMF